MFIQLHWKANLSLAPTAIIIPLALALKNCGLQQPWPIYSRDRDIIPYRKPDAADIRSAAILGIVWQVRADPCVVPPLLNWAILRAAWDLGCIGGAPNYFFVFLCTGGAPIPDLYDYNPWDDDVDGLPKAPSSSSKPGNWSCGVLRDLPGRTRSWPFCRRSAPTYRHWASCSGTSKSWSATTSTSKTPLAGLRFHLQGVVDITLGDHRPEGHQPGLPSVPEAGAEKSEDTMKMEKRPASST